MKFPLIHGNVTSIPSGAVALMLNMAKQEYRFRHIDLFTGEQNGAAYRRLNPVGQVPVVQWKRRTLAQSPVILRFLAAQTGCFGGRSMAENQRIDEWLAFYLDMGAGVRLPRNLVRFRPGNPAVLAFHRARGANTLAILDKAVRATPFLAGPRCTIADILMFAMVCVCEEGGLDLKPHRALRAWSGRLMSLPGTSHIYDAMPPDPLTRTGRDDWRMR